MQIVLHLIVLSLLKAGLAIRQFKDEYPGITICESNMTEKIEYHMPFSYKFLNGHFGGLHNCTHIEGNLIIQNIWNHSDGSEPDLSFLKSVIEITGMLLLRNNSIKSVILPNLRVIRGEQHKLINFKQLHSVSLFIDVLNETFAAQTIFPNLRVISKHSVFYGAEHPQTYLPMSINWNELFEDPKHQYFLTNVGNTISHSCNPSCNKSGLFNLDNYCWSADPNHCQKKTKCTKMKNDENPWCYFLKLGNDELETFCDSQCSGGCSGNKPTHCSTCKTYINNITCIESCPPRIINKAGKKIENPDFKLRVSNICALECPDNLLEEEDSCIYKCTTSKYYEKHGKCLPCLVDGPCSTKDCKIEAEYLTKEILSNLTDCEHFIGKFHLSERSFSKDGRVTVDMLYKHLRNIKKITGDVLIDGSIISLGNLTFLENLVEIRHLQTNPATAALNIFSTDLQFLGLRKLRNIYGKFESYNNSKLCYLNTLPWTTLILKNNQFHPILNNCTKSCHDQCGNLGCWGPSASMCYQCLGVRAGKNCVEICEEQPGYFTNKQNSVENSMNLYDDGSCAKCHRLCLENCTGPNPNNCVGGCLYFEEEQNCVEQCSDGYFVFNKLCLKCNSNCEIGNFKQPLCTGNGSHVGEGGCSFCKRFIKQESNSFFCFKNSTCPESYFWNIMKLNQIHLNFSDIDVQVCFPCQKPCMKCSKHSTNIQYCKICQGYWSDDYCVQECKSDRLAVNSLFLSFNDSCPYCDDQCRTGCYESKTPFRCINCQNRRFYINENSTQFQCLDVCPSGNTSEYHDKNTNDIVCVDKLKWERINLKNNSNIITFLVIGFILILFSCISFLIARHIYVFNKKNSAEYLKDIYSNIHEPDSRVLLLNKKYFPNMNRLLLIPTTNLIFNITDKPLGTGAFGAVYKGEWKVSNNSTIKSENGSLAVAIKVIQTNRNITIDDIFEEAKVMASVSHKHCLRLIGVCLKYEMPCLVTMFVELGSLDKYLRKYKNMLSSYDLLSWAEQIANGMAYLEMRGIIHRDLATRNVLLNSCHFVQITDFGLAHILKDNEDNDEIVILSGHVPIRWLALETLTNGIYSHKTDIWAYGITLWEMFTYGQRPYEDLEARDIIVFLVQSNRLPQPEICSLELYEIMNQCWLEIASYRPSFQDLMTTFSNFGRHPTYYLNIPNDPCLTSYSSVKRRFNSQCSYELQQFSRNKTVSKQYSMDGTISTIIDYHDDLSEPMLKRQNSNISWNSRKQPFFAKYNSILSENDEENENCFESKENNLLYSGYLEPIKK